VRYCIRELDERVVFDTFLRKLMCIEFKALHVRRWSLGAGQFVLPTLLVWDAVPVLGGACCATSSSFPSSGGFLTSCEAELQELMKQIDIMVAHKKAEWEEQTQGLEACLSVREQELSSARAALQEKQKEVLSQVHSFLISVDLCVLPVIVQYKH